MSKINKKKTKPKQSYRRFFLLRSCHYNGGKHQLSKLEITNFSEKAISVEASKANQRAISLPLIHEYWDLEDSQWSSCLRIFRVVVYATMSEGWSHKGKKECAWVHHADQPFNSLRWWKTLSLFWNSKDFYKATHFCFWYWTETFKHHEKLNSWGQEKCLAPPLNLNSPVWIFSSSPISNLISKSVELVLKMGLGDDTIVVTRE